MALEGQQARLQICVVHNLLQALQVKPDIWGPESTCTNTKPSFLWHKHKTNIHKIHLHKRRMHPPQPQLPTNRTSSVERVRKKRQRRRRGKTGSALRFQKAMGHVGTPSGVDRGRPCGPVDRGRPRGPVDLQPRALERLVMTAK